MVNDRCRVRMVADLPFGGPASTHFTRVAISLGMSARLLAMWSLFAGSADHGGLDFPDDCGTNGFGPRADFFVRGECHRSDLARLMATDATLLDNGCDVGKSNGEQRGGQGKRHITIMLQTRS